MMLFLQQNAFSWSWNASSVDGNVSYGLGNMGHSTAVVLKEAASAAGGDNAAAQFLGKS